MRDVNVYNLRRCLPRMSWHPHNLYNLWRRSVGAKGQETVFTRTTMSLYQQRWISKKLLRAYHGDFINEKIFKRWYLPSTLPDVRSQSVKSAQDLSDLNKWARKDLAAEKEAKRLEAEQAKGLAPVGSLMFREVERRIDVVIFRACLAHSVYEARRLVIHGDVLLNGKKHQNPNTRLAPGDMVSVEPKAIRFLQASALPKNEAEAAPETIATEEATSLDADTTAEAEADAGAEQAEANTNAEPDASTSSPPDTPTTKPKPKPKRDSEADLTPFHLPPYASPFIFIPAYIEPSFATCSAIYVRHPTARPGYSEIPTPWDADGEVVRAAWEWYTRVRPRMRSKSQLARMPENRQ
ncbi:hypothetical protein AcW1_010135 [Taiwanofungus camphoratus]|nr:hypothetical protein AcW1_010135 [Antrodia cinnamomea]